MGDVYQATVSKPGRSVAIKVLPESFGHDANAWRGLSAKPDCLHSKR